MEDLKTILTTERLFKIVKTANYVIGGYSLRKRGVVKFINFTAIDGGDIDVTAHVVCGRKCWAIKK